MKLLISVCVFVVSSNAFAICEYRPSQQLGLSGVSATALGSAPATAAMAAGQVLYVAPHASGAGMILGSTLGGSSAAGTLGFLPGTLGSPLTALVAAFTSGPVLIATVTAATVVAIFEGCAVFGGAE